MNETLAPPASGFPTGEDVEFARKHGFFQNVSEPFTSGQIARVLGQMAKTKDKKGKVQSFFRAMDAIGLDDKMFDQPDVFSSFVQSNPQIGEYFAKAQLAANRIPIAALGFDPEKMMVDTVMGKANIAGMYDRKSDMIYTNAEYGSTPVHESIHRGMNILRNKHPEFFESNPLPSEEMVVRYLMATQAGNPEQGRGKKADEQIKEAQYQFNDDGLGKKFRASLEKLTRLAEDELGGRSRRRGPD